MKKMVLINVITIVVLVIIGVVGFHFYNQATSFVSTDNAKVDGEQIKISAPASGEIKSLDVKNNEKLSKGDKVAEIAAKGEGGQSQDMSWAFWGAVDFIEVWVGLFGVLMTP